MMLRLTPILAVFAVAGCDVAAPQSQPSPPSRPMDETPAQTTLPNGDRQFSFANGCTVVLQPDQAVLRSESADCELYHRDIALLYASAD